MGLRAYTATGTASSVSSLQVTNLTQGQVVFPAAGGTLTGDPTYFWNNTSKSEEIGMGGDIKLFNTADKITNTEYLQFLWNGNEGIIRTVFGGTGISRTLQLAVGASGAVTYRMIPGTGVTFGTGTFPATGTFFQVGSTGSATASSGNTNIAAINGTIAQTGTAGYTALDINPTESTLGSGNKLLQRWAVGGAQKASIDSNGSANVQNIGFNTANRTVAFTLFRSIQGSNFCDATTASFTVTLASAASCNQQIFVIKKVDASANTVTIQANGAELIDGTNTKVLTTQYQSLMIQSNGTQWYII